MTKHEKILIVGPAWVGDMVMAQSLFKVLKRASESNQVDDEITVLAPAWSMPMLARMPQVAHGICLPLEHGELGLRVRYQLGRQLRSTRFDRAIVMPNSFKSALLPWFAKIPQRTGYLGEHRRGLLNDIRVLDRRVMPLNVQHFAALGMRKEAAPPSLDDIPKPVLVVEPAMMAETASRFALAIDAPIIALCPGAEYGPAKRWPVEHFAEVANRQLQLGWQVWLFGSKNDREIAARIDRLCHGRCANLCARTSLGEAVDLMALAKYAVTNDSGLMHIAAAVGCHVIAIYGSSSDAFTPPLTDKSDRLSLGLDCSPCFQRTCPLGHLNCLNELHPAEVLALLE